MSNTNNPNQKEKSNPTQNLKQTGSVILNLEKISKQYNNVLTQYNQARSNYINYLSTKSETADASGNTREFVNLSNNFYGHNTLNQFQTDDINDCQTQCSANSSCTGANFLKGSSCLLMKDVNGELAAYQGSTAIVPPEVYYLTTLKRLNQKLLQLNIELTRQISKGQPIYEKQIGAREKQNEVLTTNYKSLVEERDKIEIQLKEIDNINEAQTNSELVVNKNYTIYKYLIFAFIIIILIMMALPSEVTNQFSNQFSNQMGGERGKQNFFIIGFIILLILSTVYFYYNKK